MPDRLSKLGPYRLLDTLGQGGMGVVYRAEHETTGQTVAIKTVLVPERGLLAGIRREIHALARLKHPGIVRILEDGFERGLPWYAMELVDGAPLLAMATPAAAWWTRALKDVVSSTKLFADPSPDATLTGRPGPEDATLTDRNRPAAGRTRRRTKSPSVERQQIAPKLTLARRLCSALSYLHGEGLVHRDLKPDNILVTRDGMPVIVDFGITTRFGDELSRETLQVESGTVGTAAYMAPEQVLGELVDARADLYAFGCILYQLLTGKKPFTASSVNAMLQKHLSATPLPPSALTPGISAELDDLVMRLMEKQPERRLGHADDVAAALVRLGADEAMPEPVPQARAYLYRPRMCGRRAEMERLEALVVRLREKSGGVVLVGGESGVGKTRLVVEAGRRASGAGASVYSGECLALSGGAGQQNAETALTPFRQPLRDIADLCRDEGLATAERIFGRRGPVLSLYEPTIATLPGQAAYPPPPELPGASALARLYDALGATFSELAEIRRLVLILDDLQWADELTLGFLTHAVERRIFERHPVLVIGTYRSEEVEGDEPRRQSLRALLATDALARIDLKRMSDETVQTMVGEMLALDPAPRGFSRFLSEQSEGNPFFVAEYLRASVAEGILSRGTGGEWQLAEGAKVTGDVADGDTRRRLRPWETLRLPGSLRDLVARRLEGLDAEAHKAVEVGAILGREMDVDLLERVSRIGRGRMLSCLHDLVRRQIFEDHGAGRLRFVHDKLREVALDRLTPSRRRQLHGAAARRLEKLPSEAGAERHAALGGHWEGAGEPIRARAHYLQAARLSAARYSHAQAEALYRRYLELAERPGVESILARGELAEKVLTVCGKIVEALDEHRVALDEARALGDRKAEVKILHDIAQLNRALGRLDECRRVCEEALTICRLAHDVEGEGRLYGLLGLVLHFHEGRFVEAASAYETALRFSRQCGDRLTEARALSNFGSLKLVQGDIGEARRTIEQAIDVMHAIGAYALSASAMSNLALVILAEGRTDESIAAHEQALAACREYGYRRFEGINLSNLGGLALRQGRLEDARAYLEQALTIHREIDHRRFEGMSLAHLGDYYYLSDQIERSEAMYAQALAIHREIGNREFEGETLSELARCCLARGDLDGARALNAQALEIHREIGDRAYEGLTLVRMACVERLDGRLAEAEALLDSGEEILRQSTNQLPIAVALCERGHLRLAQGRSASEALADAEAIVRTVSVGPSSEAGRAAAQLRRAIRMPHMRRARTDDGSRETPARDLS